MYIEQDTRLEGLSLRQAAVIAGIGLLIMGIAAPFAQFYLFPQLTAPGAVADLVNDASPARAQLRSGIFAYLLNYSVDVVVAWALYILLAPTNRALSQLALLFSLVYTAMGFGALFNYVEAYRLVSSPAIAAALAPEQLLPQLNLLMHAYQFDWGLSLLVFAIVLLLRGYLVIRAEYIPSVFGWLLMLAGCGYVAYILGVYFAPELDLRGLMVTFLAEPVFMLWLLIMGPRLQSTA